MSKTVENEPEGEGLLQICAGGREGGRISWTETRLSALARTLKTTDSTPKSAFSIGSSLDE